MKKLIAGVLFGLLLAGCASRDASNPTDSRYVKVSDTTGYYILQPDSPLRDKLGLGAAPLVSAAGKIHKGRGRDCIAFRFDKNGVLSAAPAYIYQIQPNSYYTERLEALSIGRSTTGDIKNLFPGAAMVRGNGGSLVYITFPVRNPAERTL